MGGEREREDLLHPEGYPKTPQQEVQEIIADVVERSEQARGEHIEVHLEQLVKLYWYKFSGVLIFLGGVLATRDAAPVVLTFADVGIAHQRRMHAEDALLVRDRPGYAYYAHHPRTYGSPYRAARASAERKPPSRTAKWVLHDGLRRRGADRRVRRFRRWR